MQIPKLLTSSCVIAALCLPQLAAQNMTTNIAIEPPKHHFYGFLTKPYQQRKIPAINLENSPRLASLIRAGNLYLTAQDVIALTLENNIDIETQRYGPLMAREDIRRASVGGNLRNPSIPIAAGPQSVSLTGINVSTTSLASGAGITSAGGITGALGALIPQTDPFLTIQASAGHYTYPESNLVLDETSYLVTGQRNLYVTYSQQFMTGAAVTLSYNSSRADANSPTNILNPVTTGSLGLSLSQNLLQGFGRSINNRYIRIANNNAKVADLQLKQQVITTVSAVLNLYWDLVAFREDVSLKQRALEAAQKLFEDNRKEVGAGAIAALEVTRSQAEIPARQQDVLLAQTNVLQQEIVLKNALSKRGAADPLLEEIHIIPLDRIAPPATEPVQPVQDLIKEALAVRPDIQQNRINLASQGLVLLGDKSALKPTLQAFANFTNNAQSGAINPLNLDYEYGAPDPFYIGGYGTFLSQIFRRSFPNYTVGFSLSMPLRNRAAQADYATDTLQMRQQQLQFEKSSNQVGADVRIALIGLQQARTRYDTAVKARQMADEALKAEQKKYEFGKSTNAAVIQVQRDVVTAESEEVQAMANYTHARIAFDQAMGRTLERNNIEMAEAESGRATRQSVLPANLPNK
jgi:outer membrane protein